VVPSGARSQHPPRPRRRRVHHGDSLRGDVGLLRVPERPVPRPGRRAGPPARRKPRMSGALWIIGAAVALFVLGVTAELAARAWLRRWGAYYVWRPGVRLHLHPAPEVFPGLEPCARIEVNADGERGGAVPRPRGRLYRILVAGGSPVECALLDQPTSWPGALERVLRAPDHLQALGVSTVHVGNIGFSGVTSQALNLIFERVLPRFRRL